MDGDKIILQWNIVNWITVFLMAIIGYTVMCAARATLTQQFGGR